MDDLSRGLDELERILDRTLGPGKLKLSVLRHITANFSNDRKIGEGGSGYVYKGILRGREKMVAVKKLFNNLQTADEKLFQQEVATLMRVEHENIVQFIGYCSYTDQQAWRITTRNYILADDERERLLCFEYMGNGSLEDHITDELRGLEWETRFQIIRGICEGLSYLHKKIGIIHMDLKPANILLTDALVPKITDFGISRLGETTKTVTKKRVFSPGYCCPEYIDHGHRTFSSDIYSLGVTIVEVVTGTREHDLNIANVCRRWRHRWNKSAEHKTSLRWQQQVTGCLELAQKCQSGNPMERPDITDIIRKINEMDTRDASKPVVEQRGKQIESPDILNIIHKHNEMHSSASKPIVEQQRKSFLDDMLRIKPLDIHFFPKRNEQISHTIQLTNDTEDYIAFMIRGLQEENTACETSATRRLQFCMHPNKGIIPPESSRSVTITLEALKKQLEQPCVKQFCVQSTRVDKGLTSNDIRADIFKEETNKVVDIVNLRVKISALKQLLVVEPSELRYGPIKPNRLLVCSLQLINRADDYVAFTFTLPQDEQVVYNVAMGTGIMPPYSTRGVVMEILVKEEGLAEMKCKDTCLLRSIAVKKDLMMYDEDIGIEFFNGQTGEHEMELDIVLAEMPHASSLFHRPTYQDEQNWEDDELKKHQVAVIRGPYSVETELLHIYPAALRFARGEDGGYISLTNMTDRDVIYFIGITMDGIYMNDGYNRGVVPPQTTRAAFVETRTRCLVRILMVSGSRRYHKPEHLLDGGGERIAYSSYLSNRQEVITYVRAEGGMVHEALLPCIECDPHEKMIPVERHFLYSPDDFKEFRMVNCMDVHPTEPWVVTGGQDRAGVYIWKFDPKTKTSWKIKSMPDTYILEEYQILSVKFIARKKWVASGDDRGYITLYTHDDSRLIKFMTIEASGPVLALAVHPCLSYLVFFSKNNSIQLWDWDQKSMGTSHFVRSELKRINPNGTNYNLKYNNFAYLGVHGEINIFSIDSQERSTSWWRGGATAGITYCNHEFIMATVSGDDDPPTIEILDLASGACVHTMELVGFGFDSFVDFPEWFIAGHPTRPLLAIAEIYSGELFFWHYNTYRLQKILTPKFDDGTKNTKFSPRRSPRNMVASGFKTMGFIDVEGFHRRINS